MRKLGKLRGRKQKGRASSLRCRRPGWRQKGFQRRTKAGDALPPHVSLFTRFPSALLAYFPNHSVVTIQTGSRLAPFQIPEPFVPPNRSSIYSVSGKRCSGEEAASRGLGNLGQPACNRHHTKPILLFSFYPWLLKTFLTVHILLFSLCDVLAL